jgi:hypothetical protein
MQTERAVMALLVVLGMAHAVDADEPLPDAKGRTVHVWVPERVDGRLVAFDPKTITVQPETGEARTFDRSAIEKMEVKRGKGWHMGMVFAGAGAGLLAGVTYAFATTCISSFWLTSDSVHATAASECHNSTAAQQTAAMIGGTAIGALVMGLATKNAGWEDIDVHHRVSAVIVPLPHGLAMAASVSF